MKCLRKPPAARAKCLRALPAHKPTRDVESTLGEEGLAAKWVLIRPTVEWFSDSAGRLNASTWTAAVDADDRPFGDRKRALDLLAQVQQGFGGNLLAALTRYPLVATDSGHLLDGWHRLYLWVKSGLPGGPPTLVRVPGRGSLQGLSPQPVIAYHGTDATFDRFAKSKARWGSFGRGFYFTDTPTEAAKFGPRVMQVRLTITRPASLSDVNAVASDTTKLARRGFDGIIHRSSISGLTTYVVFRPEQVEIFPAGDLGRISDLCSGKDLGHQVFDHSCVLTPAQRKGGFTLRVEIGPSGNYLRSALLHPNAPHDKQLREGEVGFVSGVKSGETLIVGESFLTESFRGKRLGTSLYEALYARAQSMGTVKVAGTVHSTPASMLHRRMAEKHGLKYTPTPNYGPDTGNWETKEQWDDAHSGAYDEKWQPYQFPLNGADAPDRVGAPDRAALLERFRDAVRHVWSNADWIFAHVTFMVSSEQPADKGSTKQPLASISFIDTGVRASGSHLIRAAVFYTLRFSDKLLAADADTQWKTLIHEAAHLGYRHHPQEFRDLVVSKGGAMFADSLTNPGTKAQKKVGARYVTQQTFQDEHEARRWAKEQQRAEPGSRWRLSLGDI